MIKIFGDINFSDGYFDTGIGVGSKISKGLKPFSHLKHSKDDFLIGNFECVCSSVSNKNGTAAKQFIILPSILSQIEHLNLYGVANNHVMQHGEKAYSEMLNFIEAVGSNYVGSNDKRSITFNHEGKNIGIIAFNQRPENFVNTPSYWAMPEYWEIEKEINFIKNSDYRIAYIHWGNEFMNYPYIDQIKFAHWLIDNGIDLIVGMHPHILQGYEIYKGKYIFYSIGNFVFNMPWEPTKYGLIVKVDVKNNFAISYDYIHIGNDYSPSVVDNVPYQYSFEYLNTLLEKQEENEIYYKKLFNQMKAYRKTNYYHILSSFYRIPINDLINMLYDFVKRTLKRI